MLDDIEKDSWLVELNWAQNWPGASSFLAEAKFWFLVSVHKNDLTNQKQEAPTNAALLIILLSKDIGSHHFLYLRDNCYPPEWEDKRGKVTQKGDKANQYKWHPWAKPMTSAKLDFSPSFALSLGGMLPPWDTQASHSPSLFKTTCQERVPHSFIVEWRTES